MRTKGQQWEQGAEQYLQRRGLEPIERNFNRRGGEIDLIMRDRESLVFVEVRYRSSSPFGSGAESITHSKRRRLVNTAGLYLAQHPELAEQPCRFDVISIQGGMIPRYQWIKNAFTTDD